MNGLSQVESIFFAALEKHNAEQRARCLDDLCRGDADLRGRVERLLNAYPRVGSFLEQPIVEAPAHDEGDLPSLIDSTRLGVAEGPGTLVGPYKLLEQIGEGGFGIVFMAEQQQPVRRMVALKILKPGMDTRQVVARFEAERQALAVMDHPNIARVLDGGTTESGRPYFAMDLVRGLPITEFCDKHQLELRERLSLFVSVCQAVQHAHTKGIIHRDLKPSNVMVTLHDGVPLVKVIDFGIAKALGQQLTEKTLFTGFVQMVGTPIYMSPEQAELGSHDVDTRADIYSLGVLLYEMLTGTTPFDPGRLRQVGFEEMRRIIREEDPPRPSTRFTPGRASATTLAGLRGEDSRKLGQLFRGELDWIVMKSLEKDRNQRYETASALATDVTRYLNDESVAACPPSAIYCFKKFARRNRAALTMAAVIAAALLVVVAVTAGSIGWASADRAARDAALDREVERMIDEVAVRIEQSQWPEAAAAVDRAKKLLAAAGRLRLPHRLAELDRDLNMARELEDVYSHPEREDLFTGDELDAKYAQAFRNYGIDMAALPLDEAADRIRRSSIRTELARSLDSWSGMRRRAADRAQGDWKHLLGVAAAADPDAWRNQLREALEDGDRGKLEMLAATCDLDVLPPATLQLLGWALGEIAGPKAAVRFLRRAQRRHPGDVWLNELLGWHSLHLRQFDDSLRFYAAAQAVRPGNPYIHYGLGRALLATDAAPEAVNELTESLRLKPDFVEALYERADAYAKLGHDRDALIDCSQALELSAGNAELWRRRAVAYCKLGNPAGALADASKAIELDGHFARAWATRATAHHQLEHWEAALADSRRAVEVDPRCAEGWNNQAWTLVTATKLQFRQPEDAIELAKRALLLDPEDGNYWNTLAVAYFRAGELNEAAVALDKAMQIHDGGDAVDWVFAAMIHADDRNAAICWYDEAVAWYLTGARRDQELFRYCAEAAKLLSVETPPLSASIFDQPAIYTVAPDFQKK